MDSPFPKDANLFASFASLIRVLLMTSVVDVISLTAMIIGATLMVVESDIVKVCRCIDKR